MVILGSTGSIGVNTLKVAKQFNIDIEVLVAGENYKLLNQQIKEFKPKIVVVKNKDIAKNINHNKVLYEENGILEAINLAESDLVVNALVGFTGLKPTLEIQKLGKKLALANKESLVVAGKFIDTKNILPIDSEHFGLWYLNQDKPIEKIIITASGGAFRDTPIQNLKTVTLEDTLKHPNWKMGKKITVDSATMVNKLFEVLEAKWLFNIDNIDAVIERKSIIHSFIEFRDGSTTAHFANADMKLPIAYAILDEVKTNILKPINLIELGSLKFEEIKIDKYPVWEIKNKLISNSDLGVIINSANDFLVQKFLNKEIDFLTISKTILTVIQKFENIKILNLEDIFLMDKEVKNFIKLII